MGNEPDWAALLAAAVSAVAAVSASYLTVAFQRHLAWVDQHAKVLKVEVKRRCETIGTLLALLGGESGPGTIPQFRAIYKSLQTERLEPLGRHVHEHYLTMGHSTWEVSRAALDAQALYEAWTHLVIQLRQLHESFRLRPLQWAENIGTHPERTASRLVLHLVIGGSQAAEPVATTRWAVPGQRSAEWPDGNPIALGTEDDVAALAVGATSVIQTTWLKIVQQVEGQWERPDGTRRCLVDSVNVSSRLLRQEADRLLHWEVAGLAEDCCSLCLKERRWFTFLGTRRWVPKALRPRMPWEKARLDMSLRRGD